MYKRNYTKSGKKLERVYLWGGSYRGTRYWKDCGTRATPQSPSAPAPLKGSHSRSAATKGSPPRGAPPPGGEGWPSGSIFTE